MDGHSHLATLSIKLSKPTLQFWAPIRWNANLGCLLASKTPLGASRQRSGNAVGPRRRLASPRRPINATRTPADLFATNKANDGAEV
jgi:hypothetical protein